MPVDATIPHFAKMIFFGTLSLFSYEVLSALLRLKTDIKAIVIAKHAPDKIHTNKDLSINLIQTFKHKTIELLAVEQNIPVIYVNNINDPQLFEQLKACITDLFVVACFPYLIPQAIYELPKLTSVNIHPSLLPAFRGPSPIFWQLKAGHKSIAVTIHKLNQQFDRGKILRQKAISIKDGMRGRAIDRLLGRRAAKMLVSLLKKQGLAKTDNWQDLRQDQPIDAIKNTDYFPMPNARDFIIPLTWPARRAFNFMRGTEEWNVAYSIEIDNRTFLLSRALAYAPAGRQPLSYQINADIITIRFAQGILQASFTRHA